MSLNPFHGFRKHQKTLLGVLTIFTMIIFIFQFGQGDIFSGGAGGKGRNAEEQPVANLYKQPVSRNDLEKLRGQRELANAYIVELLDRAHGIIIERVELELLPTLKDEKEKNLSATVRRIVDLWKRAFRPEKDMPPQFIGYMRDQYYNQRSLAFNLGQLRAMEAQLSVKDSSDKKELLGLLINMLEQDRRIGEMMEAMQQSRGLTLSYFGGGNLNSVHDLLDFKIWLAEADRLGINLSNETLAAMVRQEALNQIPARDMRYTLDLMQKQGRLSKNVSGDELDVALRNEFRARMARVAVLGFDAAGANVPPSVTPYDVYQFYKDNRLESSVALLPVPADRKEFLSAVPPPKEEELRAFYDKYKKREDDPGSREPGFKAPPKRTVEWVGARADSPFYKEEAKKELQKARELRMAASLLSSGTIASPASAAVTVALPLAVDLPLFSEYEIKVKYSWEEGRRIYRLADWFDPDNSTLHDFSLNRPENVAAMVGQAIGMGGTQAPVLSVPGAFVGAAYSHDARLRTRLWTEMVLAGTQPTPLSAFGIVQSHRQRDGEYLSFDKLRDITETKMLTDIAKRRVHENLKTVEDELDKITSERGDSFQRQEFAFKPELVVATLAMAVSAQGTGTTPLSAALFYAERHRHAERKTTARDVGTLVLGGTSPLLLNPGVVHGKEKLPILRAQAYLAEAIKKYGLEHGTTSKPRDQYDIGDDAALATLKQAFDKPWNHSAGPKPKKFANMFFPARTERQQMGLYKPMPMPPGNVRADLGPAGDRGFAGGEWGISPNPSLYWATSETPAYVPPYEEVKARVLERWKLTKARDMAKKDAEAIAAEINKANAPDAGLRILRNKAEKIGTNIIYLDRVARLAAPTPPRSMARQAGTNYERYKVPEDRVEYPSARFISELMSLSKTGEAKVVADRPEATYYVAVLQSRSLPDFYTEYSRHERALMDRLEQDLRPRLRFQEGVVTQLEKAADMTILDEQYEKEFQRSRRRGSDD